MYLKLALRNIRRSVRDYAVYFITLLFGVAVFYAFNSVSSQSILFDLEDTASASVFDMTGQFLGMFSVLIACVPSLAAISTDTVALKPLPAHSCLTSLPATV